MTLWMRLFGSRLACELLENLEDPGVTIKRDRRWLSLITSDNTREIVLIGGRTIMTGAPGASIREFRPVWPLRDFERRALVRAYAAVIARPGRIGYDRQSLSTDKG